MVARGDFAWYNDSKGGESMATDKAYLQFVLEQLSLFEAMYPELPEPRKKK